MFIARGVKWHEYPMSRVIYSRASWVLESSWYSHTGQTDETERNVDLWHSNTNASQTAWRYINITGTRYLVPWSLCCFMSESALQNYNVNVVHLESLKIGNCYHRLYTMQLINVLVYRLFYNLILAINLGGFNLQDIIFTMNRFVLNWRELIIQGLKKIFSLSRINAINQTEKNESCLIGLFNWNNIGWIWWHTYIDNIG